jgi:CMP-N-acetylneuraminic acid synthetase
VKLKEKKLASFDRIIKFEMDELSSIDIDSKLDWDFAEFVARKL